MGAFHELLLMSSVMGTHTDTDIDTNTNTDTHRQTDRQTDRHTHTPTSWTKTISINQARALFKKEQ